MEKYIDYLSTLSIKIDISSHIHVISALDFNEKFPSKWNQFVVIADLEEISKIIQAAFFYFLSNWV